MAETEEMCSLDLTHEPSRRSAYLDQLHIAADSATDTLITDLRHLYDILLITRHDTDASSVSQSLYASAQIGCVIDLLRSRDIQPETLLPTHPLDPNFPAQILRNPVEWTSINVLLHPTNGSLHLASVLRTYELMQLDPSQLSVQLLNAVDERDTQTRPSDSIRLLRRIQKMDDPAAQRLVIDNLVWFRASALHFGHLAEILLVTRADVEHYRTSCLVYHRFVAMMTANDEYALRFWSHLIAWLAVGETASTEPDDRRQAFYRCCGLVDFYESLVTQIERYLGTVTSVQPLDDDVILGPYETVWMGDLLQFVDVRYVVYVLLARGSSVRQAFAERLNSVNMSVELRLALFRFDIFE